MKMREQQAQQRVIMDQKWVDLRTKQLLLKDSFIGFNKVKLKGMFCLVCVW